MIEIRPFDSLGRADHGWLNARHHFSFAGYRDRNRMNWGRLRVWNDDWIAPQKGFDAHPHSDMEIITFVREGAISHRDSLGNAGRTVAGDVQVMSAGSGITHSETNAEAVPTTLFQIWIIPDARGGAPMWGSQPFARDARAGRFVTLASGGGEAGALPIRADARVLGATLTAGQTAEVTLGPDRFAYLVAATGSVLVNDIRAGTRDGVAISGEAALRVTAIENGEVILVDTGPL